MLATELRHRVLFLERRVIALSTEKLFLTVPEAARILRIGRNKAYRLCREGKLPVVLLGRSPRVPLAFILKLAAVQEGPEGDALSSVENKTLPWTRRAKGG
ncbi:MAG: helix-turn-helix domain-containing protein [Desulfotomaculales bacterium]